MGTRRALPTIQGINAEDFIKMSAKERISQDLRERVPKREYRGDVRPKRPYTSDLETIREDTAIVNRTIRQSKAIRQRRLQDRLHHYSQMEPNPSIQNSDGYLVKESLDAFEKRFARVDDLGPTFDTTLSNDWGKRDIKMEQTSMLSREPYHEKPLIEKPDKSKWIGDRRMGFTTRNSQIYDNC
ncbi:hypothetical protein ADUPG1_013112 [Aduncisulcus paluster]|uniref:Uncharacterized protein n=1 Tax=Aduncisulcus paluster TaxID=2918883 RepID=A0ABQ5K3J5_9EUKA|nr:hypothetical protein ADUPG1_013112 [Aduncisulcus paluster]